MLCESNVRYYCRNSEKTFCKAKNDILYTVEGDEYIDFLSGAGSLNYGHNNPYIKECVLEYLKEDNILQGLDLLTEAKNEFLQCFWEKIMKNKKKEYNVQFCGPTGTNAMEAAIKLAKKYTKRNIIFAFMGSFHGMTQGTMNISSRLCKNNNCIDDVFFIPLKIRGSTDYDCVQYIRQVIEDEHSGVSLPAAIVIETIQAEGGVILFDITTLKELRKICDEFGIILIFDEIQVGCFRTGKFFSFEEADIEPDFIALSKSISGIGLPMSLLLIESQYDIWEPGEHTGTFRGNQLAYIGAKAALEFAEKNSIEQMVKDKEKIVLKFLNESLKQYQEIVSWRGKGLIWGIDLSRLKRNGVGITIARACNRYGVLVEVSGNGGNVLKILPPLTINKFNLIKGLEVIVENSKKEIQGKV